MKLYEIERSRSTDMKDIEGVELFDGDTIIDPRYDELCIVRLGKALPNRKPSWYAVPIGCQNALCGLPAEKAARVKQVFHVEPARPHEAKPVGEAKS